jgi:hypothetical protein
MRRGRKIAKVAMARKLAAHLYWMWRQGREGLRACAGTDRGLRQRWDALVRAAISVSRAFRSGPYPRLGAHHPGWKDKQPFKAVIENDMKRLAAGGMQALVELVMAKCLLSI